MRLPLQGLDGALVLSNSVHLADSLRIASELEQQQLGLQRCSPGAGGATRAEVAGGTGRGTAVVTGYLMVVKAFLGRTASDSNSIGAARCVCGEGSHGSWVGAVMM